MNWLKTAIQAPQEKIKTVFRAIDQPDPLSYLSQFDSLDSYCSVISELLNNLAQFSEQPEKLPILQDLQIKACGNVQNPSQLDNNQQTDDNITGTDFPSENITTEEIV